MKELDPHDKDFWDDSDRMVTPRQPEPQPNIVSWLNPKTGQIELIIYPEPDEQGKPHR